MATACFVISRMCSVILNGAPQLFPFLCDSFVCAVELLEEVKDSSYWDGAPQPPSGLTHIFYQRISIRAAQAAPHHAYRVQIGTLWADFFPWH